MAKIKINKDLPVQLIKDNQFKNMIINQMQVRLVKKMIQLVNKVI